MNLTHPPLIALTMGDPAGVGPEICLRALAEPTLVEICTPIVFGDAGVLRRCAEATGLPAPEFVLAQGDWPAALARINRPAVLDLRLIDASQVSPGVISAATGEASYGYIQAAIDAALADEVAAVTTGPISKEALHAAGHPFPGHTEIFASRTHAARSCMLQYSPEITCSFVTTHVGYSEVPALLTTERILEVIELTAETLRKLHGREPRLVICGLNPHAGEHGLFGQREEERLIVPAIEAARAKGIQIEGPLPADTAFIPAKRRTTQGFICLYHDQGHIPVKALAFDSAVNTTLGLPIVRTSVDHGTACDIAWTGEAKPDSLFAALRLAARLTPGHTRSGFTLVELLAVMAIIGLLVAILLPAVQQSREAARRTGCVNNLRQWGLALAHHENRFAWFPAGYRDIAPTGTFVAPLLPFFEQSTLGYDTGRNWDDPANLEAIQTPLNLMICPSSPSSRRVDVLQPALSPAAGDYVSTHGVNLGYCLMVGWPVYDPPMMNGVLTNQTCRLSEIVDGTSSTIMLVECAGRPELWRMGRRASGNSFNAGWADPNYELALDGSDRLFTGNGQGEGPCVMNCTNDNEVYSFHKGGANLLFADGSVRLLSDQIDPKIFAALSTKASGEVVPGNAW